MRFSVPSSCACSVWKFSRRFELRIVLDDCEQPRERRAERILCLRVFCEILRIVDRVLHDAGRNLTDARARLRDVLVRARFEVGGAFDRRDEIGNQVGAPLVDVLHLPPLRVDRLAERDERVIRCGDQQPNDGDDRR